MNKIRNNAGLIIVVLLIVFIGTFLASSLFDGSSDEVNTDVPEETSMPSNEPVVSEPPFKQEGKLWFIKAAGDTICGIDIEVADDEAQTSQGLMYRKSMAENQGMLFIFDDEQPRSFWMKNTNIPLDIIYADGNGVIGSAQNYATPFSEQSLPSLKPAKYVVEVNAGFWDKYGVKEGDKFAFVRI